MEEIKTFWTLLDKYNIEIPIIQRDYVQGRASNEKAERVRENFLSAITEKLDKSETLHLDFIYGCMQGNKLILLDGQQRLTTLFLLHWYTAVKEKYYNIEIAEKLQKFKYQTRPTSERFCSSLAQFYPDLSAATKPVDELIKDQSWFFIAWENDPTIVSMLNMLKNIEIHLGKNKTEYFNLLTSGMKINFHFLNLDKFRLSDSLYIKMNARGKQLTEFENFKAGYEKCLSKNPERQKYFAQQADRDWTEMFWKESGKKHDEAFMNYIEYITEIGFYLSSKETIPNNDNKLRYNILTQDEYRDFLFKSLDSWFLIKDKAEYFEKYFSKYEYEQGKLCLFDENVNLFSRCINKEHFDNREKLLLYGFILQIQNNKEQKRELRLLRNLLINSRNELRTQNLHTMYTVVKNIFTYGFDKLDLSQLIPFNGPQIEDETAKAKFLLEYPECTEDIYMLEDTELLQGRLLAFNFDKETLSRQRENFCKCFVTAYTNSDSTAWVDIHRALLCLCKEGEDKGYAESVGYNRWQFGNNNDNWQKILTSGDTSRLKTPLNELLTLLSEKSLGDIIRETLDSYKNKDKDWKYYFIRYKTMNVGYSGRFVWEDDYAGLCMLNTTRLSGYWRDPYLWTICERFSRKEKIKPDCLDNIGYEYTKQPLKINNLGISNAPGGGWIIRLSEEGENSSDNYDKLRQKYSINSDGLLSIKPSDDRVEVILPILEEVANW
jgi:hypothetical protein